MALYPPRVSFEFFPPKTLDLSFRLWSTLHELSVLNPEFMSVTYGAGGKTRELTHDTVCTLSRAYTIPVAAHLTCVGASKAETLSIAQAYRAAKVQQLVALRGDPPAGAQTYQPHPHGYETTCDLITDMSQLGFKEIYVGAYPETHPEAAGTEADIDWLKRKFDAGATAAITQFFFDSEVFLRFRDRCAKAGINQPLIPGILPIENWSNTKKFAKKCGASIPAGLDLQFDRADTPDMRHLLSIAVAVDLCDDLMQEGVEQFHFYTLNRPELTFKTCQALGVSSTAVEEKVAA